MSETDKKPEDWATYFWAGDQEEPEVLGKIEHSVHTSQPDVEPPDRFEATGPVEIPPAPLPSTIATPEPPPNPPNSGRTGSTAGRPSRDDLSSSLLTEAKKPSKGRRLTSGKGLAIIGVGLALNLAALTAILVMGDDEPKTLTAEVLDSDEYADEDSLRIEIPLNPNSPETANPENGVEVNQNLAPLQMVITDGKIVLRGTATSDEQAQEMADEAAEVFAGVPLVREYIVDEAAPPPNRGVVVQKPVVFEPGSAVIRDEFKPILDACADVMKQNPTLVMNVSGHTDSDGSPEYNLKLAEQRAQAVIDYYGSQGLDPEKFALDPLGENAPIDSNETEEGKEANRRTDLEFEGVFDEVLEESGS